MPRRIAPRYELWRSTKLKGGWTEWFLVSIEDDKDQAWRALDAQIASRKVARSPHPARFEIRKVTTVVEAEPVYEPKSEWRAKPDPQS